MKTQYKSVIVKATFVALALAALSANATPVSPLSRSIDFGTISGPYSLSYGNTFFAPTPQQFYDVYTFTLSQAASFNSITVNINLGSFLGINNLSARLDQGIGPFNPSAIPLAQNWSTAFNAGPSMTGSITTLSVPVLQPNAYTLAIRGDAVGLAGGSYSGSFNVALIPEPETYAMLFAGMGLLAFAARRKDKNR